MEYDFNKLYVLYIAIPEWIKIIDLCELGQQAIMLETNRLVELSDYIWIYVKKFSISSVQFFDIDLFLVFFCINKKINALR
ncbi:hypothetical protein JOD18_004820 [Gracilibacillus alcaliphilus]|nr:hypothetical protein [Gracilibacillus alcaliphilus]